MSGTDDKLVYMANQIATAFRAQEPTKAAQATCDHIRHFWDPRMRARIVAYRASGAAGLNAIAAAAVDLVATAHGALGSVTPGTDFTHKGDREVASDAG